MTGLAWLTALCALSAVSAQAAGPPECTAPCQSALAQLEGFAYPDANQKDTICLCNHDGILIPHSLLVLECDWEHYSFNLKRKSSGQAIQAEFKQLDYAKSRNKRIGTDQLVASPRSTVCQGQQNEVEKHFPYINGEAEMSIVDGRLYYNTFVQLKELYETKIQDKCINHREFKREVTLSCCADGVPGSTSVPPVTPPLHLYCDIANKCTDAPINCQCDLVDDKYQISQWHTASLPNNLGVQLTKLEAHATGSAGVVQNFVENGVSSSLPDQLGFEGPFGANPQHYSVNPFEFASNRGSSVTFKCEAEYCSKGNAYAKKLPTCRSYYEPQVWA